MKPHDKHIKNINKEKENINKNDKNKTDNFIYEIFHKIVYWTKKN